MYIIHMSVQKMRPDSTYQYNCQFCFYYKEPETQQSIL